MTDRPPADPTAGSGARDDLAWPAADSHAAAALWVGTFQTLAGRIAHDLRNALNAVAVNLEVVRGRSARGAEPSAIAPFAATAATQYESASAAAESLLWLARSQTGDADVAETVTQLGRLVGVRNGGSLGYAGPPPGGARVAAPWDVVRAVVARSVLSALDVGDTIACETTVNGGIFLRVTAASHLPPPDPELVAVASAYGVRFTSQGNGLEVRFPAAGARATPSAPA